MRRTSTTGEGNNTCTHIYSGLSTKSGHLEQRQLKESVNFSKTKRNMYDARTYFAVNALH